MPAPLSLEIPLSLSAPMLAALLEAFGPATRTKTARDLARALFEERAPTKLARPLGAPFLGRFGTDSGKRALIEAARAAFDARADDWLALRPADLAATIAVQRATAKGAPRRAIERIVTLARQRVERDLPERPTYELVAPSPAAPIALDAAARPLVAGFGKQLLETWAHTERDGSLRLALFLRGPRTSTLVAAPGGVLARDDDPIAIDLLRMTADRSRVALTLAVPERLADYIRLLGLSLRPSFTLRPFHDLDSDAHAAVPLPPGVRGFRLVGVRWRSPSGERTESRADPVASPRAHAPRGGYIDRLTLRTDLEDRTADAFLQLPHRIEIPDRESEPLVRALLGALRTFEPGLLPDDARSLAPYEHPDWRWCGVVTDDGFKALVARKLVRRVEVAHVATEELRMYGASYVVRPVQGSDGDEYALAEDRAYGARLGSRGDRTAWKLDTAALAAAMREDLSSAPSDAAGALGIEGVLDLGTVTLRSGKLRFVYAMASPPRGWLEALRRACGIGTTPVILVPRGHTAGLEGFLVIELDVAEQFGAKSVGRALGRAADALGVGDEIEIWRGCEEEVVIDAGQERVWVEGVLVALSDLPYRFLEYLAREARVVTSKEIGAWISAGEYPEEAARRVKRDLEKQMAAIAGKAGDARGPLVVTEGKKGYRLGWRVKVVGGRAR
ncbi:MAG TPA: hypothetical protein VGI39_32565 [Polyangiaceae bacterium]|jgi:hypothetical protein